MQKFSLITLLSLSLLANEDELKELINSQQKVIEKLQNRIDKLENKQTQDTENMKSEIKSISTKSGLPLDISLITDFSYVNRDIDNSKFKTLEIPAFTHSEAEHSHEHEHAHLNEKEGFNFNYAELGISSAVDPYFDLNTIFHLSEDSFEIEEGYISTKNLPIGVKVGKFFSNFGRLNSKHHHYWSFADQPIVYNAFFGEHNLLEKGIALNYIFPTSNYLMAGFEVLEGSNENSFGVDGFGEFKENKFPNLYVGYVKSSLDFDNLTLLGEVSFASGDTLINHGLEEEEEHEHEEGEEESAHGFVGDTKIYGVDLTLRYDFDSYKYLSFENEYLYRKMSGLRVNDEFETTPLTKKQAGFYSKLYYKFNREFGVGARYEMLNKNDIFVNSNKLSTPDDLDKYSFIIEYAPSEFSKLRLQFNKDNTKYIEENPNGIKEVLLQLNFTIGSHAPHPF